MGKTNYGVKSQDQFTSVGTGEFWRFSEGAHRMLIMIYSGDWLHWSVHFVKIH